MKKRGFLNLCVVAAALSVTAGTLYSCKDYDDEIYAEMNGMNSTLSGQIATQEEGLAALKAELEQTKADNAATKEVLQNSIDEINKVLNSEDNGLVARIIALENAQAKVAAQLETIGKKVDENFNVLSGDIADLAKKVAANEAAAKANEALIKETEGALKKDIEANAKAVKEQGEKLDQILTELAKAQTGMNAQIAEVKESVAKLAEEHKADIEKLNGDVKALTEKVDANTKALEEMGLKLDKLSEKVNQMVTSVVLNGAYSPVVGYFSLPTGLKSNILAAYYGSVETSEPEGFVMFPAKSLSEAAGGLKGKAFEAENGKSLVATGANAGKVYVTVNPSSVDMTNKTFTLVNSLGEVSPVSFGKAVESKDKLSFGYTRAAGNKNFYEIPATLDSARIEEAKLRVEMSELKEVMGEVKTALANKSGLDVTKLASTLFKCVNDLADANAVKVSWKTAPEKEGGDSVAHDVMSDFGLAAVAVKPLSFNFAEGMNKTQMPGVDKAYAFVDKLMGKLRGFADEVKPNFNFEMKDLNIGEIKLKDLNDDLLAQFLLDVSSKVSFTLDATNSNHAGKFVISEDQNTVEIVDVIDMEVTTAGAPIVSGDPAKSKVTIQKQTLKVEPGKVDIVDGNKVKVTNCEVKTSATVTVDMRGPITDFYESIGKDIEGQFGTIKSNLEEYVKQIDQLMADLKAYQDKVNSKVDGTLNEIESKLNSFITKVNGKLCQIVNNFNAALQPVMFANGIDNEFVMISGAQSTPSLFPSSFTLVPSSYSGEYLAPAAQKYVAVTNVFKSGKSAQDGDDACKSAMNDANEKNADLNKVLEGANHAVAVAGLKSGYTYEFTYSAVDFYGKVANTKCYVTVK